MLVFYYLGKKKCAKSYQFFNSGQEIANEARKLGLYGPTNSLWCYFMKMGNTAEAQSTWEILKSYTGAIKFQSILRQIRKDEDIASAENLVKTLASSEHVKPSALGVAYSAWLDVLRKYTIGFN